MSVLRFCFFSSSGMLTALLKMRGLNLVFIKPKVTRGMVCGERGCQCFIESQRQGRISTPDEQKVASVSTLLFSVKVNKALCGCG
jgi:hypothetical protein